MTTAQPWTLVEKVVCFEIMDGERLVARIDRPCRTGDDARIAAEAKLLASAPDMAKSLGKIVEIVRGDALLMFDPKVGALVDDAEKLLGMTQPERADEQHP